VRTSLDTNFCHRVDRGLEVLVSTTISVTDRAIGEQAQQWLGLALMPGLGPSRVRRLIEYFAGIAGVFRASLTELEATGLLAVSAQSIGTGKSFELAQKELEKAESCSCSDHFAR
jgi:hypothetical protein